MRYKATFKPSYVLDSFNDTWYSYKRTERLLDAGQRAHFEVPNDPNFLTTFPTNVSFTELGTSYRLPEPLQPGYLNFAAVQRKASQWLVLDTSTFPPLLTTFEVSQ